MCQRLSGRNVLLLIFGTKFPLLFGIFYKFLSTFSRDKNCCFVQDFFEVIEAYHIILQGVRNSTHTKPNLFLTFTQTILIDSSNKVNDITWRFNDLFTATVDILLTTLDRTWFHLTLLYKNGSIAISENEWNVLGTILEYNWKNTGIYSERNWQKRKARKKPISDNWLMKGYKQI